MTAAVCIEDPAPHAFDGASGPEVPRRVRLPRVEPPYDDEWVGFGRANDRIDEPSGAVQGTLALALHEPVEAWPPPPLWLVPTQADAVPCDDPADSVPPDDPVFARQPTETIALPAPRLAAARLVPALLEVLAGDRPARQLCRVTAPALLADLERRTLRRHSRTCPASLRSLHVCEPVSGVAEVAAVVQRGQRVSALALRMEGLDGRWLVTALQVGR